MNPTDNAVLATIVTALLIRQGGQALFSDKEWEDAIEHTGSIYIHRDDEDKPTVVALMQKTVVDG